MMKTFKSIFLFSFLALLAWSCSDSTSPDLNKDVKFSSAPYAKANPVPSQADSSGQLAQQIPGFGGMFIDGSGLNIYLTKPDQQKAKAISVLSNWQPLTSALANKGASVPDMNVKKGQYSFTQLHEWKKKISGNILGMDGVYTTGIDQSTNKVSIGVKDKTVKNNIASKLGQLNIPTAAVAIYQMGQPELY